MGKTYKEMKNAPKWERINKRVFEETETNDRSPRSDRKTRDSKDKPKGRRGN